GRRLRERSVERLAAGDEEACAGVGGEVFGRLCGRVSVGDRRGSEQMSTQRFRVLGIAAQALFDADAICPDGLQAFFQRPVECAYVLFTASCCRGGGMSILWSRATALCCSALMLPSRLPSAFAVAA